jgi:hypothetical protein
MSEDDFNLGREIIGLLREWASGLFLLALLLVIGAIW